MGADSPAFRVALTADFYNEVGAPKFPELGLEILAANPRVEVSRFAVHQPLIQAEQVAGRQGVLVLTPSVTRETLANSQDLLAFGRYGVGYDSVDVAACTEADVLVMITVGAVDRPVAEATIGWMLALSHKVLAKDRIVREGRWHDRVHYMGKELRERSLGVIGFGGIGRALVSLLVGFGMHPPLVYDPFVSEEAIRGLGARAVGLEELLAMADFVSIHCPLNEQTRGLIGEREIRLMKREAYLLNTARGGIVDEEALFAALRERRIAGAALDCFVDEPVLKPSRFAELENVLLAPHAIAWTDELFRDMGRTACRSMLDLSLGRRPQGVVNAELLGRPSFLKKWAAAIGLAGPEQLQL